MVKALWYGFLSLAAGVISSLFWIWIGPIVSISIIGVGIISSLEKRK